MMKGKGYLFLYVLMLLAAAWGLPSFCYRATDGFTIAKITPSRPWDARWETRPLALSETSELDEALGQSYRYFGCGGQCYAFFSEDGRYVIKFLKQHSFKIPWWHSCIPIPYLFDRYKAKKRLTRKNKIEKDFASYKVAFEQLQDLTGVVYVHLNPTGKTLPSVKIIDKLEIEHTLDLNQFDFIVQKRAELLYPKLLEGVASGQLEGARTLIDQIVALIDTRCAQGYEDWDQNLQTNCGFLNGKVIKIDVGRFIANEAMKEPKRCQEERVRIMTPLYDWLEPRSQELAAYCQEVMQCGRD